MSYVVIYAVTKVITKPAKNLDTRLYSLRKEVTKVRWKGYKIILLNPEILSLIVDNTLDAILLQFLKRNNIIIHFSKILTIAIIFPFVCNLFHFIDLQYHIDIVI